MSEESGISPIIHPSKDGILRPSTLFDPGGVKGSEKGIYHERGSHNSSTLGLPIESKQTLPIRVVFKKGSNQSHPREDSQQDSAGFLGSTSWAVNGFTDTRWAPDPVINGVITYYNPYKWPYYKWLTVLLFPVIGVLNPVITGSGGPPCILIHLGSPCIPLSGLTFLSPWSLKLAFNAEVSQLADFLKHPKMMGMSNLNRNNITLRFQDYPEISGGWDWIPEKTTLGKGLDS